MLAARVLRLLLLSTCALLADPELNCGGSGAHGWRGPGPSYDGGASPTPPATSGAPRPETKSACTGVGTLGCKEEPLGALSTTADFALFIKHAHEADRWGNITSSGDLLAEEAIEIATSDLPSSENWSFMIETPAPLGVECLDAVDDGCRRFALNKGTRFRVQRVRLGDRAVVRIIRQCSVPCASSELRCFRSQACLHVGFDFCLMCEGNAPNVCACRNYDCTPSLDGKRCTLKADSDGSARSTSSGFCSNGTCAVP